MNIRRIFAANLKRFRKQAGLTQEQLAAKSGLHRTYIGGIEQKRINVSLKNIEKIADALGISPSALLIDDPPSDGELDSLSATTSGNGSISYAICSWASGEMEVFPVRVLHEDLSVQVVSSLVKQGLEGEDLARAYDRVVAEMESLFNVGGHIDND